MFESISSSLQNAFAKLRGKGVKLTKENMEEGLTLIRRSLLEADVNFKIAKNFVKAVSEKALGEEVLKGLDPAHQVVDICHKELLSLMGESDTKIPYQSGSPTLIMMAGLQGSGKTTTVGKLAHIMLKENHRPLLVAADVQRPAAIEQLKVVGAQVGVPVYSEPGGYPPAICQNAIAEANKQNRDVVIFDTAGRLHIDEMLMQELDEIVQLTKPHQIYLVVDAMTGQDAVNSAKAFGDRLQLDGVVLTKLDGDARGGAAISIRAVTGKPIKFCGVGEKLEDLQEFHPDRMAGRILGMGDVLSLIETAKEKIDEDEAQKFQEQIMRGELTLDGFLKQLEQVQKMGPMKQMLSMIPGIGSQIKDVDIDDGEINRVKAIMQSMTPQERHHPEVISASRRNRISKGSGSTPNDVARLLKQFKQMKKMMSKQMGFFSKFMGKGNEMPSLDALEGFPGMKQTTVKEKKMNLSKREAARKDRKKKQKLKKKKNRR